MNGLKVTFSSPGNWDTEIVLINPEARSEIKAWTTFCSNHNLHQWLESLEMKKKARKEVKNVERECIADLKEKETLKLKYCCVNQQWNNNWFDIKSCLYSDCGRSWSRMRNSCFAVSEPYRRLPFCQDISRYCRVVTYGMDNGNKEFHWISIRMIRRNTIADD